MPLLGVGTQESKRSTLERTQSYVKSGLPPSATSEWTFHAFDTAPHIHAPYSVTGLTTEDALSIRALSHREEAALFANRDKLDVIVIQDGSSKNISDPNSPLSVLFKAIHDMASRKFLKNMLMLLIWRCSRAQNREFGKMDTMSATVPTEPKCVDLAIPHRHRVRTRAESSTAYTTIAPVSTTLTIH